MKYILSINEISRENSVDFWQPGQGLGGGLARIGRVLDLQALVAGGGEVCVGAVGREAVGAALEG